MIDMKTLEELANLAKARAQKGRRGIDIKIDVWEAGWCLEAGACVIIQKGDDRGSWVRMYLHFDNHGRMSVRVEYKSDVAGYSLACLAKNIAYIAKMEEELRSCHEFYDARMEILASRRQAA